MAKNGQSVNFDRTFVNTQMIDIDGNGTITGTDYNDNITGGAGNDTINAGKGDDVINAGAGDDVINAGDGNDAIYAGIGENTINAGAGSNTIYVNTGDGINTLLSGGGSDTLVFNNLENLSTVSGYFAGNEKDLVLFGDGAMVVAKDFTTGTHSLTTIQGNTEGSSINLIGLNGLSAGNLIFGTAGADNVASSEANEIFLLGNGNDIITFANIGGRNDVIILGEDSVADTLIFSGLPHLGSGYVTGEVVGKDVVLHYNKVGDEYYSSVTIKNFLDHEFAYDFTLKTSPEAVESYKITDFVENTIYNPEGKSTINGTKFKDNIHPSSGIRETVYAGDGNDYVYSVANAINGDETGGDIIYGGAGNDHLLYNTALDETTYIDGGTGDDEIRINKGTAVGGLGVDSIRIDKHATVYGDLTLEEDPDQTQGGNDEIWTTEYEQEDTLYGGG